MTRTWSDILREHQQVMAALADQGEILDRIANVLIKCLRAGHRVYVCGNGGSAADAQHIACELLGRFKTDRPGLAAIALSTDTSTLTAIANDFAFDQVFARQVRALARPGDVVWALSTSGNSPNILAAAQAACECGAILIGFTGQTGGKLAPLCLHAFRAPHTASDRIQETHALAYHYLCERIEAALRPNAE